MYESAQASQIQVLLTNISSFFGLSFAKRLLEDGVVVYGIGKSHLPPQLLVKKNFTLLDLDLTQPLPTNLPRFEHIYHFLEAGHLSYSTEVTSPVLKNLLNLAAQNISALTIILPLSANEALVQFLAERAKAIELLDIMLVGNLYGPAMDLNSAEDLNQLIAQAILSDKVVLKNEGLEMVYPTNIADITNYLTSTLKNPKSGAKKLQALTSNTPQNTLTIAYTIQKAAELRLNKQLGLFFGGREHSGHASNFSVPAQIQTLPNSTSLEDGLYETLGAFASFGQVSPAPKPVVAHPSTRQIHFQQPAPKEEKYAKLKKIKGKRPNIKIPRFKTRIKWPLAIAFLSALFFVKLALDLFFGLSQLKNAKQSLSGANWQQAQRQSQKASGSLSKAKGKMQITAYPFSFVLKDQTKSLGATFQSLVYVADSINSFSRAGESLSHNITLATSKDVKTGSYNFETTQSSFASATQNANKALAYSQLAIKGSFFPKQSSQLLQAAVSLNSASSLAKNISHLFQEFTGTTGPKTYLMLFQNNMELRPGGGFIGNVGLVEFENGKLKNISVEDVYNIDGQLKEKLEPPAPLKEKLGVTQFYLRDSNWNPDFEQNALLARDFFKKETGRTVDGIIAIDLNLMEEVLKATGPIKLADYNEEISAENLFERGEYYSEIGFFPGSTQKKDFFGSLSRALIAKILQNLSGMEQAKKDDNFSFIKFVDALQKSINGKHLMMTFDNQTLGSFVRSANINHPLPPASHNLASTTQTTDFLALSEANVGANKVNRYVERKMDYEMTIGRDADLVGKLTITYTNNSQGETWPGGKYVNYLRVYAPIGASLFEYQNGDSKNLKDVTSTNQGSVTYFATYVEVPIRSQKTVTFTYRIPKNIKLETAPTYRLYVQKQPGTGKDPFTLRFNLPNYIIATALNGDDMEPAANIKFDTDLSQDREFVVDVRKK